MMKKNKLKLILIILIVLVLASLGFGYITVKEGIKVNEHQDVSIEINSSMGSKDVFDELEKLGVINNSDIAYYYSRVMYKSDFKAGKYNLSNLESIDDIIDYLSDSNNAILNTVRITFVEGDWLQDYARKLADNTVLNEEDIMNYWTNEGVINQLIEEYDFLTPDILDSDVRYPLEGYLFPDTYEFYIDTTIESVTAKLLNQTKKIYNEYLDEFNQSELSIHEIFTLASIVQYEASNFEDMKNVAGVFYNRLNDGMKLQSSVTVCYAIAKDDLLDDWTACEYNSDYDDPYNTYMYHGLPPGPILNPGKQAIEAVLMPNKHDYYYFIGDVCPGGDGSVYFARTLEEHNANVREYLWCY